MDTSMQTLQTLVEQADAYSTQLNHALAAAVESNALAQPMHSVLMACHKANDACGQKHAEISKWGSEHGAAAHAGTQPPVDPPPNPNPIPPPYTAQPGLQAPPLQLWVTRPFIAQTGVMYWIGVAEAGFVTNSMVTGVSYWTAVTDGEPIGEPAWQVGGGKIDIKPGQFYCMKYENESNPTREMRPQLGRYGS